MPRITTDQLDGYQFTVQTGEMPEADEHGNIIHDAKGQPKTRPITILILGDPMTGHRVVFNLFDEAKQELIRQLTGGIILPGNGQVTVV